MIMNIWSQPPWVYSYDHEYVVMTKSMITTMGIAWLYGYDH